MVDVAEAVVRRAGPADMDTLVGLVSAYCAVDGHVFDRAGTLAALTPLLTDDEVGFVLLAVRAGRPVGYAVVTWGHSIESGGREALLDELYAKVPGTGVGTALVTAAIERAAAESARRMFLETEAPNRVARAFYRKLGFDEEPSVWMSRSLTPDPNHG